LIGFFVSGFPPSSPMQAQKPPHGASDEYVSEPFAKPIIIILMTSTAHMLCWVEGDGLDRLLDSMEMT
jgi:hypothetical protein